MSKGDPVRPMSHPRLREQLDTPRWRPRRKRALRRLRNDLRNALPMLGIVLCFGLSAGAIFATDWLPVERESSPPAVSAARSEQAACESEAAPRPPASATPRASAAAVAADRLEFLAESVSSSGLRAARPRR